MKKLFFLYAVVLVSFFVLSPARYGEPRGIEQHMVTITENPTVFFHDEFARCLVSSSNTIIISILSHTDLPIRQAIHYSVIIFLLYFLYTLARRITSELWTALLFLLFMVFNDFNYAGLNSLFLSHDFDARLLAGPFIALALKYFLDNRPWPAAVVLGAAFYLHAGVAIWFLVAVGSGIVIKFFVERPWINYQSRKYFWGSLAPFAVFLPVFLLIIFPRMWELYGGGTLMKSAISDSMQLEIFKHAWAGQTSLFVALNFSPAKWMLWGVVLTNILFLIVVLTHFNPKNLSPQLKTVYYCYVGTFVFVVVNEILINYFQCSVCVYFGLLRVSSFNFLFLSILLSVVIVEVYRRGIYGEFILWMLFIINYSVIHFKYYSFFIQFFLLICILLSRNCRRMEKFKDIFADPSRAIKVNGILKKSVLFFLFFVVLLTGMRYYLRLKNVPYSAKTNCEEAVEFVNVVNKERSVVLYPFDRSEEFFTVSQSPGFFNTQYIVLFNRLYRYDPLLQLLAYEKFVKLEHEFGIDTVNILRRDPYHFEVPWREAWASKVDREFIERWAKKYPIGYIIREKELASLPYEIIYENDEFTVYRRKLN